LKWGLLTRGADGRTVVVKERNGVDGAEHKADIGHSLPHYLHIIDVANLIPSEHLILYVPPSANVNFRALCAIAYQYRRSPGVRHLTLIFGDSYPRMMRYQDINEAVPKDHGLFHLSTPQWWKIEIVLLPRISPSYRNSSDKVLKLGPVLPSYYNDYYPPANFTCVGDYDILNAHSEILQDRQRCEGLLWRIKGIDAWWEEEEEAYSWLEWGRGRGGKGLAKGEVLQGEMEQEEGEWTSE
jgi:hypothetical protein